MNIYLLTQDDNMGYDTYDSLVVCAESEEDAKKINPYGREFVENEPMTSWAKSASSIKCEYLGVASSELERGVILASFNAG